MSTQSFGKYLVTKSLGRGGMAEVFLARDPVLERNVAIKVIHPHLATDPDFGERFRREAKLVASLRHAHIVQLYDFDIQNNQPFMVMEYLDGASLKTRLAARALPLAEIARILNALASALEYAHARGAIHRDVKPANILFTENNEPVLADFGIAKIIGEAAQLSVSGAVVGSPAYMSPEQAASKSVDARSDIYALGVVAYEMATGRVPFQGDSPTAVLMQHLNTAPPPPRQLNANIPEAVQAVILRALAKDPADRFASAGEFARAFNAALRGELPATRAQLSGDQTMRDDAPPESSAARPLTTTNARWLSRAGKVAQVFAPLIGRQAPDVHAPRDRRSYIATILGVIGILIAALQFIVSFFDLITRPIVPLINAMPYLIVALFIASSALSIYLLARSRNRTIRLRAATVLALIVIGGGAWSAWTLYNRLTPPTTFVIAIGDFAKSEGTSSIDFGQRIYRRMSDELKNGNGGIEVQRASETYSNAAEARTRGSEHKASLVIWGQYDNAGVTTDVELLQIPAPARESFDASVLYQSTSTSGLTVPRVPTQRDVARFVRVPETLVHLDLYSKNVQQQIDLIALSSLALAFQVNGDADRALALFDKTLQTNSDGVAGLETIRFYRATVLLEQNRVSDAASELEQALKTKPDFFEAQFNLAIAYSDSCGAARLDAAIEKANAAARLRATNPAPQQLLADLYRQVGKNDLALRALDTALKLAPNDARTYELLATLQTGDAAKTARQKAIALREQAKAQTDSLNARLALADAYLNAGEFAKALAEFQAAEKIAPADPRVLRGLANAYYYNQDLPSAERVYQQLLAAAPQDANAHLLLGLLYHEQGKAPAAIEELQQAAKLSDCSAAPHLILASLYFAQNDFAKAIAEYQAALKINPQDADALYLLGALQYQEQQPADAEKNLQAALALRSNFPSALFALSAIHYEQQQYQRAATEREQLTKLAPNEPYYYAALAFAYEKLGRLDDALAAYQKSLALKDDADNHVYIGLIYNRQNKFDAALAEFQKALALKPNDAFTNSGIAATRFQIASAQMKACNLSAATESAKVAVSLNPSAVLYRDLLAQLYEAQNRGDDAAKLYTEMRGAAASDFLAHLVAGEYFLRATKLDDATRELQIVLATPNLAPLWVSIARMDLGETFYQQDKLAEAEREFQAALTALAANVGAQARLGDLAARRGDPANALVEYDRALAVLPSYTQLFGADTAAFVEITLHARRGLGLTRQNKNADANAAFDRATSLAQKIVNQNPQWAIARFNLGFAFLARGDQAKADTELAAAALCNQSLGVGRARLEAEIGKLK